MWWFAAGILVGIALPVGLYWWVMRTGEWGPRF